MPWQGCFMFVIHRAMKEYEIKEIDIDQLVSDDANVNAGTERGRELLDRSLEQFGAGRSVLLDKDNKLMAGNKTAQASVRKGIKKVLLVETEGEVLVAVRRKDIDLDTKEGREMALADNAVGKADLSWNKEALKKAEEEFGFKREDWGLEKEQAELATESQAKKFDAAEAPAVICPRCFTEFFPEDHGNEE